MPVVNGKAKDIEPRQLVPVEVTLPLDTWRQPFDAPERKSCEVEAMVDERRVVEALVKVWRAVQLLALPTLSTTVLAALPSYEPESVIDESPAVRALRVPPRATPLIVEF